MPNDNYNAKQEEIDMQTELPDLHIFARVVEAESFREAAEQLRMARSSVSKRIGQLENELGVVLFNRSTRRISLTDAGQTLYQHWGTIARNVDEALAAVRGFDQSPTGTLRVSMPSSLGAAFMPALMQKFLKTWPDLKLNLDFREQYVDIVGKGYDAVIHIATKLPDSRLMARRLATTPRVLVASPGYLKRYGAPGHLKALKQHYCLGLGFRSAQKMTWTFKTDATAIEVNLEPSFAANNDLALILAACLDGGILYSPRLLIESEIRLGRLCVIDLDDATGEDYGVFAIYPQSKPPAKVKVFAKFVGECLEQLATTDRWAPLRANQRSPDR